MEQKNNQVVSNPVPNTQPQNNEGLSTNTKTIITIILLVFVYPVGLILMYVWMKWKGWVKALIAAPGCLLILVMAIAFIGGILSTVNPSAQIKKGKCVASCQNAVNKTECQQKCFYPK